MPISNEDYAIGLMDILGITDVGKINEMIVLQEAWNGGTMSNALLAREVSANQSLQATRDSDISRWAQGTATEVISDPAGQPEPGYYPIRITRSGSTVWEPSPEKLQAEMEKGDPAKTSVIFEAFGKPAANVRLGGYKSPGGQVFTNAGSVGYCAIAPTVVDAVFTVLKNGSAVGVITIAVGSTNAVFNLTGGQVTLVKNDRLEVTSPTTQNATLSGPSLTFAGD